MRVFLHALPHDIKINDKQMTVLLKLINGKTYKSIATEMHISLPAVRQYAHRLYKKLKVSNKTEALIKYGAVSYTHLDVYKRQMHTTTTVRVKKP